MCLSSPSQDHLLYVQSWGPHPITLTPFTVTATPLHYSHPFYVTLTLTPIRLQAYIKSHPLYLYPHPLNSYLFHCHLHSQCPYHFTFHLPLVRVRWGKDKMSVSTIRINISVSVRMAVGEFFVFDVRQFNVN